MVEIDPDKHPGLYRYSIELLEYPELTDAQYAAIMDDLDKPGEKRDAALRKLICHHLGMVLAMAQNYHWQYELSMEDFVGVGNMALVERANRFKPDKNARFSTYMRKVVIRWVIGNIKDHVVWQRADGIEDIEHLGMFNPPRDGRFWYVHKAMEILTDFEQRVAYFLFFDPYEAEDREIAKTLHITLTRLRQTRKAICDKLRPVIVKLCDNGGGNPFRIGDSETILEPEENNERNN